MSSRKYNNIHCGSYSKKYAQAGCDCTFHTLNGHSIVSPNLVILPKKSIPLSKKSPPQTSNHYHQPLDHNPQVPTRLCGPAYSYITHHPPPEKLTHVNHGPHAPSIYNQSEPPTQPLRILIPYSCVTLESVLVTKIWEQIKNLKIFLDFLKKILLPVCDSLRKHRSRPCNSLAIFGQTFSVSLIFEASSSSSFSPSSEISLLVILGGLEG